MDLSGKMATAEGVETPTVLGLVLSQALKPDSLQLTNIDTAFNVFASQLEGSCCAAPEPWSGAKGAKLKC
jgi:hypothetical protein